MGVVVYWRESTRDRNKLEKSCWKHENQRPHTTSMVERVGSNNIAREWCMEKQGEETKQYWRYNDGNVFRKK